MIKSTDNKKTTTLVKSYTTEEVKEFLQPRMNIRSDPEYLFGEVADILPKLYTGNKKDQAEVRKLLQEKSSELSMALGLTNHYHLTQAVRKQYRPLVLSVVQQIEKEYNCTTASDKALAELAALAHVSVIESQRRTTSIFNCLEEVDDPSTRYIAVLNKQTDRANRQFITAITTLRQMKQPQMQVNIKTNNAFVANNQQVNHIPTKS